jgi:hypothetical protein
MIHPWTEVLDNIKATTVVVIQNSPRFVLKLFLALNDVT